MLLVVGLFRDAVIGAQQFVALEIDLRHLQLRLALCQLGLGLGLGLGQAGLNRTIVEGGQQIALFDQLPFLDQQAGQDAIDLRADHHAVQRQDRTDATGITGDVPLRDGDDLDRDRHIAGVAWRGGAAQGPGGTGGDQDDHNKAQHGFLLNVHGVKTPEPVVEGQCWQNNIVFITPSPGQYGDRNLTRLSATAGCWPDRQMSEVSLKKENVQAINRKNLRAF